MCLSVKMVLFVTITTFYSVVVAAYSLTKDTDPTISSCSKLSSCSCRSPHLGVVDLSPLAKSDGSARFQGITSGIQEYSWNPCRSFTQGDCKGVAVCQKSMFPNTRFYNLGTQDSAQFTVDKVKGLQIIYTASSWGWPRLNATNETWNKDSATYMRTSYVKLVCDLETKPGLLVAEGEDRNWPGHFASISLCTPMYPQYFTLTSYHACPSYLKPQPAPSSMSTGSCLLIGGFLILTVYFVLGSAIQILVFKRSGLDAIPNKTFWVAVPGLVKDGTAFVLQSRRKTGGYSEV